MNNESERFVQVIDDALPDNYLKDIIRLVNSNLTWDFREDINYDRTGNTDIWNKMMVAPIIQNAASVSKHYDFLYPIIYLVEEKFQLKAKSIFRMKINKTFTVPHYLESREWHTDSNVIGYKSVVLYLDDSDGDTLVSNLCHTNPLGDFSFPIENIQSYETVEYKQNRMVLFDSHRLHCGSFPKEHKCRTVMNLVMAV